MLHFQEAGQGTPLVLLHAFPLAGEMWRSQLDALSDEFRVIVPDLLDGSFSIDDMAYAVMALLENLNLREPIILGGLSMGGYTSLSFARHFPQRLRALILCDTRAEADTEEAKANRDKMIALAEKEGSAAVVEQMIPKLLGETTKSTKATIVEEVRGIGLRQSPAAIASALRALRDRRDSLDVLPQIKVPTLVVVGEEDSITPLSAAQTLAQGIANAKLEIIAQAGHLSNIEQPDAFNGAVRNFIREFV